MFRNIGFGAAAVLAVGALAIGCGDDGDTIIGGGQFTTDNFPGSQVQDNNVADDGRAFSNQGQNIIALPEVYWNVSNGTAIALYQLQSTQGNNILFYAAYFDGNSWSTPVQIRGGAGGAFEDPSAPVVGFKAIWLNTAGLTVPEAAARDGDAVILFTRRDLGPNVPNGSTTQENPNIRLWMTYFDRSAASSPAAGGVVGGFTTTAITVDDDNIFTTGGQDPDVATFGFVSDSLDCGHEFTPFADRVDSGQPTSFLSIFYRKDGGTSSAIGPRYLTKAVIGDAVGNDLDDLLDSQELITPGVGSFATGDTVGAATTDDDVVTVYNALMFWQNTIAVVNSTTAETSVTVTRFDEDGPVAQINLGPAPLANEENDVVNLPRAAHVYGQDHGLASTDVIFTATGFRTDQNPNTGDTASDRDLYVARINNESTTLSRELVQIDNFPDTIVAGGAVTQVVGRNITGEDTRINRTGEFITVLFNQANTDASTDSGGANAIHVNEQLYVTVIQTRRTNRDPVTGLTPARDLADSVFDLNTGTTTIFEPRRVPAAVASGLASGTGDEPDVSRGRFQEELAGGQATSQADVSCHLGCVIQSNSNRVNFLYTQFVDIAGSGTNVDEERLLVNGITVDLGDTETDAPTFTLVDTSEEVVATRDIFYPANFNSAFAMDAGDVTRDAQGAPSGDSGRPLVFYVLNQNNPTDAAVTGAFTEIRAFVWDGAPELLSTDDAREFGQVAELLGGITVAKNENITGSPHHSGSTIHVFWIENVQTGPGQRLMTRSYNKGAINDGDTTNDILENRFTPNLVGGTNAGNPVQIDRNTDGPLLSVNDEVVVLTSGNTVGIYFDEDDHIYYSDTDTDALGWDSVNGTAQPQLVDNDSPNGARVLFWDVRHRPACDALPKSMVGWARQDFDQFFSNTAFRAYVRVHN